MSSSAKGTIGNPYSMSECDEMLDNGTWPGGYVRDDSGTVSYVMQSVTVQGYSGSGSGSEEHGSDFEFSTGSHEWHEPDDEENGSEEDGNRPPSGNEGENQTGGNFGGGTGGSPGVPTGREYIAYIASQYIGRNETDDIDLIKSWLRNAGFSQPNNSTPWCAAFAYNMFQEAGYEGYKSASVSQWKEHYGRYVTIPEVGDVAFFPNMSHIGIVVDIAGENITVIHGNWSNKVSKTIHTINYFDAYKRGK